MKIKEALIASMENEAQAIKRERDTANANFEKAKGKLEICVKQINEANEQLSKYRDYIQKKKEKFKQ